jgi:hypothetical protein
MSLEFIESDEDMERVEIPQEKFPEWRPGRMGLGYTIAMQQTKQKKEAEKRTLEQKLLGKRKSRHTDPDFDLDEKRLVESYSSDDDDGDSKLKQVSVKKTEAPASPRKPQLSKSQKKRQRKKNK